jgi:predicted metalloprotease with PDZ domain
MARDGAIGVDEAWRRLDAGFRRSASATAGMSLKQASARIGSAGNSQRVYWAGAGLMLAADLELRKRTSGRQTLGSALEQLATCCLGEPRRWDAQEVIEKLDALTGESVFRDLASENLERSEFPDGAALLQAAGVRIDKDRVEFDDGAPYAVERKALMPRP